MKLRAALAGVVLLVAACGDEAPPPVAKTVDPTLAPAAVVDGKVKLYENTDDATKRAFADAGPSSLMADGRLWELRRADRLIGTLQISTVEPDVDLTRLETRDAVVGDVLVGASQKISISGIEVATLAAERQAVFVWFGDEIVEILTVDGFGEIDADDVVAGIIAHQISVPAWEPLQPGDDAADLTDLPE